VSYVTNAASQSGASNESPAALVPKRWIVLTYAFAARSAVANINFDAREERLKNPATSRASIASSIASQLAQ
jgi:L-cystine uptake protein TcyP (sodium:dicarboxylate symporter family)